MGMKKLTFVLSALSAGLAFAVEGAAGAPVATNRTETLVRPGFTRVELVCNDTPCWRAYILKVDLSTPGLRFAVFYPEATIGRKAALSAMNGQLAALLKGKGEVVAGINGDYFGAEGFTQRLNVSNGCLVQTGYNPKCSQWGAGNLRVYETTDGRFHLGDVEFAGKVRFGERECKVPIVNTFNMDGIASGISVFTGGCDIRLPADGLKAKLAVPLKRGRGASVKDRAFQIVGKVEKGTRNVCSRDEIVLCGISPDDQAYLASLPAESSGVLDWGFTGVEGEADVRNLVGAWLAVIRDGVKVPSTDQNESLKKKPRGYPRTCMGLSARNNQAVFFVSDGRQEGWSKHMTTDQVADILLAEGCENAVQFDGGGSTEMIVQDKIVNRPSDVIERPLASGMFFCVTK